MACLALWMCANHRTGHAIGKCKELGSEPLFPNGWLSPLFHTSYSYNVSCLFEPHGFLFFLLLLLLLLLFHVASATMRNKQCAQIKERGREQAGNKGLHVSVRADKSLKIQLVLSIWGKEERLMGVMSGSIHHHNVSITQPFTY